MTVDKKNTLIVSLLLPFLVLLLYTIYNAVSLSAGTEAILPISGYDPRDLISGHYLAYQVDYPPEVSCGPTQSTDRRISCYCITDWDDSGLVVNGYYGEDCEAEDSCIAYIGGECKHGRFTAGIERYYISESKSIDMDRRLRDKGAYIRVSIDSSGKAMIKDLIWDLTDH